MSNLYGKSSALVALVVGAALMSGAACAQTAAPAPGAPAPTVADAPPVKAAVVKPRKRVTPTIVVLVTNSRAVPLTELDAAAAGGAPAKQIVANLAPGKKTSVKVAHGKSCLFDLHGAYADGSSTDLTSIDLCKDKTVNLVE
ncbi:hypothetical protein [Methylocapsa sp. S129]|uniref:hypothetical protein n=1 Tax=Methylocapsa sp. S129 TaxID=1641869 RepID=UPI00131E2EA5|nr:hypothetical protein [Methylocapsa sp. S129]